MDTKISSYKKYILRILGNIFNLSLIKKFYLNSFNEKWIIKKHKSQFINSCNAMLHARSRGETFGAAIGEFSIHPKTIIINDTLNQQNHIDVDSTIGFPNSGELVVNINGVKYAEASGNNGIEKRMKPYVPNFKSTPANITEPAVGAST